MIIRCAVNLAIELPVKIQNEVYLMLNFLVIKCKSKNTCKNKMRKGKEEKQG